MTKIKFIKRTTEEVIKEGTIREEGILDGMMHYVVDWNDGTTQVTAALPSTKYVYHII